LISKKLSSENAMPNESKLGMKHPWEVLYQDCSFSSDPLTKKLNTELSIGASQQISAHFGKAVSEKKIFRN
jgi:hypothetical protein